MLAASQLQFPFIYSSFHFFSKGIVIQWIDHACNYRWHTSKHIHYRVYSAMRSWNPIHSWFVSCMHKRVLITLWIIGPWGLAIGNPQAKFSPWREAICHLSLCLLKWPAAIAIWCFLNVFLRRGGQKPGWDVLVEVCKICNKLASNTSFLATVTSKGLSSWDCWDSSAISAWDS